MNIARQRKSNKALKRAPGRSKASEAILGSPDHDPVPWCPETAPKGSPFYQNVDPAEKPRWCDPRGSSVLRNPPLPCPPATLPFSRPGDDEALGRGDSHGRHSPGDFGMGEWDDGAYRPSRRDWKVQGGS